MSQARQLQWYKHSSFVLPTLVLLMLAAIQGSPLHAQDAAQGPIAAPPEHHVTRIGNVSEPEAPPSLPEAEIIKRFSLKEDERSEEHTSELQSPDHLVCRLLLEKKKKIQNIEEHNTLASYTTSTS